ncbi:histidine kinase dimerization/phospho-acceptor domain-containing protein [Sphingomonas sp. BK580]|uniref:ATP-binding protein n=1 Tax=Sphingomonas sp. BK580 TaxID=2586972 RepID=UPI00180104EB|nr:histidine kinase dimerization/phospho-acceptor domain-containing protein [Sphingomonas sp. BK580]MBB3692889.1 signal transduction histidine kinase [Sphingomonas sp. BK580]
MRFDDSLKTVLAADVSTAFGARAAFRQLVDLIGRGRAPAEPALVARLRDLRVTVPAEVRAAAARGLALADPPAALVAFFAEDTPEIAATMLRVARLAPEEWDLLLPQLGPHGRSVLRRRSDLAPSVGRALEAFGSTDYALPEPVASPATAAAPPAGTGASGAGERFEVADLVHRIEAYQRQRGAALGLTGATPPPVHAFRFETDAAGIIRWVDTGPRGALIGLSLNHDAALAPSHHHVDGVAAGAFRKRATFADARLHVPGESAVGGDWRISGAPMFDLASGSFVGFRGRARRPRAEESAAATRSMAGGAGAEGLRRLVHELRTPTNAIAGFSELIEQELLGPVPPRYRDRAAAIRRHVAGLIGAIDDLDLAARLEGNALDLRDDVVAVAPLLARVAQDLAPLAALRGGALALPEPGAARWAADAHAAERLVQRLLATLLAAATGGELLGLAVESAGEAVTLVIALPAALAGRDEAALLALDDEAVSDDDGAPLLGTGFALRLARNLALELGGRLDFLPERLRLALPSAATTAAPGDDDGDAPRDHARGGN